MLPKETENLINEFTEKSKDILGDNLVGIYLHGSAVMGCFNPGKSDIDLIIVVNNPMTDEVKKEYLDMVVKYNEQGPSKGIEMSVVLKKVCNPFVYPTPFETHFSVGHLNWYKEKPDEYIKAMKGEDTDLAAHFTIINKRGKCLCGAPIKEVFADVPSKDYMDSIWDDIAEAPDDIADNTMYLTLNLARVLAYKKEGLVLSKKEGGEWAINNLPQEFHSLITDAMREYEESAEIDYDIELAKRYAEYLINEIRG